MKKVLFLIAMAALTLTADEIKFNWKGKAEKVSAPKIEEIKDEDWVSYRCTPTAKGPWQGMIGTSSVKVDLNKFKGVAFDINHSESNICFTEQSVIDSFSFFIEFSVRIKIPKER